MPEDGSRASTKLTPCQPSHNSCAPSCLWWAAFACILTAPRLLGDRPTCHPIGESSVAVIWRRGGAHRRTATACLARATLSVHPAAPLLLAHRPTCLPIGETIRTIVWVSGSCRHDGHDGLHHWRQDRCDRRGCWGATTVMNSAAPCLFVRLPRVLCIHSTIEGIDRTGWCWPGWRRRWRRCGRRSRRHCGWRCGWCCWHGCRQSCGRSSGAANANLHAAVLLLRLGPSRLPLHGSIVAIVQICRGQTRQQPEKERQQQTQQTACRDEASEIPSWPHRIEISSTSNILICCLLDVAALSTPDIRHGT